MRSTSRRRVPALTKSWTGNIYARSAGRSARFLLGNSHDSGRHAELWARRHCVRTRRGTLSLRHGRPTIPRFRRRHRGDGRGPLPSPSGGRADPPGTAAVAYVEPLPHPGTDPAGRAPDGGELRRHRFLLQFGRGGDGSVAQDRAQVPVRVRAGGTLPVRRLRRQLPRPDARADRGGRQRRAPDAASARCSIRSTAWPSATSTR